MNVWKLWERNKMFSVNVLWKHNREKACACIFKQSRLGETGAGIGLNSTVIRFPGQIIIY